ncbi:protein FAM214B isoform X2 [Falco rusticolus]|uniref:protein FAM214B isoform X2 n=1 Tax=Falco rusticolus TaxID=120794 RepID=UPI000FFBAA99|nr:protein FAM214B isoform X2 [Falco rusticolus]XP_055555330.1 atos homolog protein B isoform X2 [Falco cherrug]
MRHIHAETSLPPERSTDSSLSQPSGEAPLEPSSQHCAHHSILMGYKTEIKRQKVYQVSIFSHLSSSSESMEQRAGSRAAKRSYPEQRTLERGRDPKRTHWGGRGVDSKCDGGPGQASLDDDDTFEDGLLVEELSLYGSAQHFSHSGLRVVEHRCEGSPSHSPKASREDKLQDVSSSSWPQHIACSTLHMRDSCPVSLGDQHPDYGENGEQASGHNLLHLDLHSIAQTAQLGSDGKEKPGSSPAHNSRASGEEEQPVVSNGCREPPASQTALSPKPGNLSSLEKMPCGSSQLSSSSSCKAKRKLLPAGDVVTDSEDESLSPWARKKRVLPCHMAATACRSTDAKGAPFWNHLLPKAQSFADCSAVERRLKSGLHLKSRHLRSRLWRGTRSSAAPWATTTVSHALLGNFEGVIDLEALGKKGYSVPKAGTIQVTLFNPNKTVVKMFLVTYDFEDMPANHITFLRHRIFLVPVGEEEQAVVATHNPPGAGPPRKVLCYLMHLRFHSSKSGKIYLHNDIRMLFSRKSIEVDSGIPYELKSFTEMPRNPCYSPRA